MSWIRRLKDKRMGMKESDQPMSQSRDASVSVLEEVVGLFPVEDNPSSQPFDIDIVAIHGLGGHYQKTWTDGNCNWLRDFLPGQLRDSNINPRVMCYGYDAGTAFSKSVLAIHNVAEDLLDRLRLSRNKSDEKQRPIILIAHSLGGLIVKKAMNTAWNNPATYGPLLEKIYGLVFFGVPHRGADLAYWAGLPASLLDHALVGFGGNRSFLKALQKNSDEWRSISRDFTQRGAGLSSIRTFFETERLGNIWIVHEDSARLFLSNESCTGIASSNHISMCKFDNLDSQKYKPVGGAVLEMAEGAMVADEDYPSEEVVLMSAYTPLRNPNFYGREDELGQMARHLKPGRPGRTIVVLWGLGSFGKTQLARQFQHLHSKHYKSQVWLRPSLFKTMEQGTPLTDVVLHLNEYRSRVLLPPFQTPFHHLKARLELEANTEWLLVIDEVENFPTWCQISTFLPQCKHGTIILTMARKENKLLSDLDAQGIHVGKIDTTVGTHMFLDKFKTEYPENSITSPMIELSEEIVENLDGSPLAIEQAGAFLSSQGPLSVEGQKSYLLQLKDQYTTTMAFQPGTEESYYDKENKSILSTFALLEAAINQANSDAMNLLTLCSFLDTNGISISMLLRFKQMRPDLVPPLLSTLLLPQHSSIWQWLHTFSDRISNQETSLQQAVKILGRFCSVKIEWHKSSMGSFTLENSISRWCRGRLQRRDLESWAVAAAYMISCCCHTAAGQNPVVFERKILTHVRSCDEFLFCTSLQSKRHDGFDNLLSWYEWHCSAQFAMLYHNYRAFPEALRAIRRATDLELLLRGDSYLKTRTSLEQYHLMAIIYRDCGEYTEAGSIFVELLSACKESLVFDDPLIMRVAKESKDLWSKITHDEILRQRVSAAFGDRKTAIWSPLRETVREEDQTKTFTALSNHAQLLFEQGKYADAEVIYRQRFEIQKDILGKTHPATLETMEYLAFVLLKQEKYAESEIVDRQRLEIQKAISGKTYPNPLQTMKYLAFLLSKQRKDTEAEAIIRHMFEIQKEVLGKTHPNTLKTMKNLAFVFLEQKKYIDTEIIDRQILEIQKEVLGKTHPDTLKTIKILVLILIKQGKNTEAEAIERQMFEI